MKRVLRSLFLVGLCGIVTMSRTSEPYAAEPPDREHLHIFLLVGQSNMAGRGKVSEEDKTPVPRVLMLDKEDQWRPAVDPLHFDKRSAGTGLGKTFGMEIARTDPAITVGLVPCAVGGTSISLWEPEKFDKVTKTHPWDDAIRRAKIAMKSGTLRGILWHQGEADGREKNSENYPLQLRSLVERLRQELNAPDVPFVVGQLGQFPDRPWNKYRTQVDAAHRDLPAQVPHAIFVKSDGLTHGGDGVHFNAESYREFGKRYAKAFLELSAKKPLPPASPSSR